jgi:hypothetical protein
LSSTPALAVPLHGVGERETLGVAADRDQLVGSEGVTDLDDFCSMIGPSFRPATQWAAAPTSLTPRSNAWW